MSMYRVKIYQKHYADDTHYRYRHFWGAKKDKLMVFATTLNLTNTKERCHKSLPLDEEDYYSSSSPKSSSGSSLSKVDTPTRSAYMMMEPVATLVNMY